MPQQQLAANRQQLATMNWHGTSWLLHCTVNKQSTFPPASTKTINLPWGLAVEALTLLVVASGEESKYSGGKCSNRKRWLFLKPWDATCRGWMLCFKKSLVATEVALQKYLWWPHPLIGLGEKGAFQKSRCSKKLRWYCWSLVAESDAILQKYLWQLCPLIALG